MLLVLPDSQPFSKRAGHAFPPHPQPAPAAAFLVHALAMIAVQRGQPLPDAADKKTR